MITMMMARVCKCPEIHKEAIGSRIDNMQIVPANLGTPATSSHTLVVRHWQTAKLKKLHHQNKEVYFHRIKLPTFPNCSLHKMHRSVSNVHSHHYNSGSQGSQNQTAGARRRRKSPRQSCPTGKITWIKDADQEVRRGLMIQEFNILQIP